MISNTNRYNTLGRLKQVISPAWPPAAGSELDDYLEMGDVMYNRIVAYEYDAAGNVTKRIANYKEGNPGALLLSVSLDPGDVTSLHLSTDEPDINLATCVTYDVLNRPVFTREACVDEVGDYYPDNGNVYNRVTYTAYDELNRPIVVVDNYDGPTDPPISGDITLSPSIERNHVTRIYYDGLVLLSQTFDPYGNPYEQSSIGNQQSSMGWTGEQSDPSGLTYLRARYYAPGMGRFTQIDPFAGALVLPSSLNGYAYGHGNPTRYTDPDGLCGPLCWFTIAAVG